MVQMGLGTLENKIGVPGFLEKKLFFGKFSQNFWFCLGFWKIRQLATFSDLAGKHLIRSVLVSAPHRGVSDLITPKNKRVMTIFLQTIPQSNIPMYFGHFWLKNDSRQLILGFWGVQNHSKWPSDQGQCIGTFKWTNFQLHQKQNFPKNCKN